MERSGLRRAQGARLPLYERTKQFRAYSCWMVPGLIQTEEINTRAVLRAYQQRRGLRDDVEAAVAERVTARQRVLRRDGRTAAFVLEESVLRNGFGGQQAMSAQLAHLAEVTTWPAVSLGIIPASPDRGAAWRGRGLLDLRQRTRERRADLRVPDGHPARRDRHVRADVRPSCRDCPRRHARPGSHRLGDADGLN